MTHLFRLHHHPAIRLLLVAVLVLFMVGNRAMACPMGPACCVETGAADCSAMAAGGIAACKAACAVLLPVAGAALVASVLPLPIAANARSFASHDTPPETPPPRRGPFAET